jgi:hypothetical protein
MACGRTCTSTLPGQPQPTLPDEKRHVCHASAQLHIVTSAEIKAIEALGFSFSGSSMPANDFINTFFPNFNLFAAVRAIDTLLSSTTTSILSKEIILTEALSASVEIRYYSQDWNDKDTGLALVRTFTLDNVKPVIDHDFFRLPRSNPKEFSNFVENAIG